MTIETRQSWIQTGVTILGLMLSMVIFAMAYEHRTTVLEQDLKGQDKQINRLIDNQQQLLKNQGRLSVILQVVEERHRAEDRATGRRKAVED